MSPIEAEARRRCGCDRCEPSPHPEPGVPCRRQAFMDGLRAGLARAAVICGNRANALISRNMSDYKNGAFDEAEACARAIEDEAK